MIVLKSKVEPLIKDLHEAGVVDIRKTDYEGLDEGRPLTSFDLVSTELLRIRSALAMMEPLAGKKAGGSDDAEIIPAAKAIEEAKAFEAPDKLRVLNNEAVASNERLKSLDNEAAMAEKLSQFKNVDFKGLSTRTIAYKAGEIQIARIQKLSDSLERIGSSTLISEGNVALVLYSRKDQQAVDAALAETGFNELSVPAAMTTPSEEIRRVNAERELIKTKLKQLKDEMTTLSKNSIIKAAKLFRSLEVEADRAEVATRFPQSRFLCVIEGWMLEESRKTMDKIAQRYGSSLVVEDVKLGHDEMPPTVLDNPKIASPLEFITNSYSLPNYFELDPTMIYLIALPIIYGMIVGDVVYGLLSIIIGYLLMKKFEKSYIMSNVSKIWMYSGVPSMAFGLFFDEFAGMSHFKLAELFKTWTGISLLNAPLWTGFHRMESVVALVALSALLGVVHLTLGFIFGAINEWEHNKKHSAAKIAWIGVEIGLILALLPFMPMLIPELGKIDPGLTMPGLVILVISVIVIAVTEGIIGLIELPGLVGNILSYSRIAAVGIVGVVIAELLNDFLVPTPDKGILLALVLAPIFIILHVLNCFVAMFESLIQGGRLNIVEFKSKFMHGGGGIFVPFALYSKKI